MRPTVEDAKRRALVRLPDGRVARLVYWPGLTGRRRAGQQFAKVQLPGGAILRVAREALALADMPPASTPPSTQPCTIGDLPAVTAG